MKLGLSNEANQPSFLICGAAKIEAYKLSCEIAFMAIGRVQASFHSLPKPNTAPSPSTAAFPAAPADSFSD